MHKVKIISGNMQYTQMMRHLGYDVVNEGQDFLLFTGGADVDPMLYGEAKHPASMLNPVRDRADEAEYVKYKHQPKVGICRGGQFLNVMSGGKMFQHVQNHAIHGTHQAMDTRTGMEYAVTSTHHQMMRPSEDGRVLLVAWEEGYKQYMNVDGEIAEFKPVTPDCEAVWYEQTKSLCFQPHPEFGSFDDSCTTLFEMYLDEFIVPQLKGE